MTTKEVRSKVQSLEFDILQTLVDFQNKCGVNIESIDLEHIDFSGKTDPRGNKRLNVVKINLSL